MLILLALNTKLPYTRPTYSK